MAVLVGEKVTFFKVDSVIDEIGSLIMARQTRKYTTCKGCYLQFLIDYEPLHAM